MAILAGKYDDLGVAKKKSDPDIDFPSAALPLQPQIHPLELPRNSSNVQQ